MATVAAATAATTIPNRNFPLRILVDSDNVGAIIGRSGSTIRSITQHTRARIDVHREESLDQKEKIITISGSPESCSEACNAILRICLNEYNSPGLYEEDDTRDSGYQPVFIKVETLNLDILAPSNLIGRLIGKGGASIKKIMEQTSTKIRISMNPITESTGEHTIRVNGNLEQLRQAEKLISSKLRTALMSDMNLSLQTMSQQSYMFNNLSVPYMNTNSFGPHPSIMTSMLNHQTNHGNATLSRNAITHNQHQMSQPVYPNGSGYFPMYPGIAANHSATGGIFAHPLMPRYDQEKETVYMYIPGSMVGAIIGKSGYAIKEMISTSGATIKVATTSPQAAATNEVVKPENVSESTEKSEDKQHSESKSDQTTNSAVETSTSPSEIESQTLESPADTSKSPSVAARENNVRHRNETNLSSDLSSTRKVTIIGTPASQYSAQYLIYRKVSMESGKSDISLMVEIHVPSQLVGKIIGIAGSSVKNLQKQTRTAIRLPDEKPSPSQTEQATNLDEQQKNGCNDNPETKVQITGAFEGSIAAQRHIRNLVRESQYMKQVKAKYNPKGVDVQRNQNAQTNSPNVTVDSQQSSESSDMVDNGESRTNSGKNNEQIDQSSSQGTEATDALLKQESLPSNCCNSDLRNNHNETHTTNVVSIPSNEKSHSASNQSSKDGTDIDIVSNNNTIINSNLSKNESSVMKAKAAAGGIMSDCTDSDRNQTSNNFAAH